MMRDAPWTGIGVGAFIVEFPSYLRSTGGSVMYVDTALNLALHAGAELGVFGLALTLTVVGGLIRHMIRIVGRDPEENGENWLGLGAAAGLAAFFVNFLFHTYVAEFEAQFLFWLLAALVFESGAAPRFPRGRRRVPALGAAAAAVLAVSVLFLGLSLGKYSVGARAEIIGWPRSFGFYALEEDPQGGRFRWTRSAAGFSTVKKSPALDLAVRALNPDLAERPLAVRVYFADRYFRKLALAGEILFRSPAWMPLSIPLPGRENETLYLRLEPGRTWSPKKSWDSPDPRLLGISIKEF
jgi:hypothetical protein